MIGFTIEILDEHCKKQYAGYMDACKKIGVEKPFTFKKFVKENGYVLINAKGKRVKA
jgi:uncharacterized protein YxeA